MAEWTGQGCERGWGNRTSGEEHVRTLDFTTSGRRRWGTVASRGGTRCDIFLSHPSGCCVKNGLWRDQGQNRGAVAATGMIILMGAWAGVLSVEVLGKHLLPKVLPKVKRPAHSLAKQRTRVSRTSGHFHYPRDPAACLHSVVWEDSASWQPCSLNVPGHQARSQPSPENGNAPGRSETPPK